MTEWSPLCTVVRVVTEWSWCVCSEGCDIVVLVRECDIVVWGCVEGYDKVVWVCLVKGMTKWSPYVCSEGLQIIKL